MGLIAFHGYPQVVDGLRWSGCMKSLQQVQELCEVFIWKILFLIIFFLYWIYIFIFIYKFLHLWRSRRKFLRFPHSDRFMSPAPWMLMNENLFATNADANAQIVSIPRSIGRSQAVVVLNLNSSEEFTRGLWRGHWEQGNPLTSHQFHLKSFTLCLRRPRDIPICGAYRRLTCHISCMYCGIWSWDPMALAPHPWRFSS